MSAANQNNAPLSDTTKSQQYLMFAVAGMALLTLLFLLVSGARSIVALFFNLFLAGIAIGLQLHYIKRIRFDWQEMAKARRWRTGIAALIIPPIAAVVGGFLAVFGLVIWIASLFFRSTHFPSIGAGSTGSRSTGSTAWIPNFGSWWGNERVIPGSDGRPLWVGDDEVKYGSDGMPIWVGNREVKYGQDGRPDWIGDDKVSFRSDGQAPKWIGDREVSL